MMYTPQATLMTNSPNDSCFVDIDLTDDMKRRTNEVTKRSVIQSQYTSQVTVTMDREPGISIWRAAEEGNLDMLNYFIHHLPIEREPNEENDDAVEQQPHEENEDTDIIRLVNTRDPDTECTLLHLIVSNNPNPLQALRLLLESGADATARNIYNVQAIHALFLKCKNPLESLQLLIKHDADVNAKDGDGWTPVHYAARFCKSPGPILKYLLSMGADINAIDTNKKSALFALLANDDHSMLLDWLINNTKVNIRIKGDFLDSQTRRTRQGTLILQAAKYGRLSCLRILVSSSSAMESLEPILTHAELEHALNLVRQQLIKVTKRDHIERLGLMIMILENLIQKLFHHHHYMPLMMTKEPEQNLGIETNGVKRRPSLISRIWRGVQQI